MDGPKAQERVLWQNLGQITNSLQELLTNQNPGVFKLETWLEIGMLSSNFKQIFERLQIYDNLKEVAVVWKAMKDSIVKFAGQSESIDEIDKILASNTNLYEALAISFRYHSYTT